MLNKIVIVLSNPTESGNVGAVCRAMKNCKISKLRIVSKTSTSLDEQIILARSVHATDVWENALFFDSLKEAIFDCSFVIGTSRRRGRNRKSITMPPHETALYIEKRLKTTDNNNIAIVFGNERTGLETDELALCNAASHIPCNDEFPSYNLSHAVQIYCYELFLALSDDAKKSVCGAWNPITSKETELLSAEICDSLSSLGFYKIGGREEQERFFKDILARAAFNQNEARYLCNIFHKAARLGN